MRYNTFLDMLHGKVLGRAGFPAGKTMRISKAEAEAAARWFGEEVLRYAEGVSPKDLYLALGHRGALECLEPWATVEAMHDANEKIVA